MNFYAVIFYILAAMTVIATALAITRKNAIHAVIYLILSFISTALLFYLLGAPFVAALEVIIYAGAIMVLFLFIVMMLQLRPAERGSRGTVRQWLPAIVMGGSSTAISVWMIFADPGSGPPLRAAMAGPRELGRFLFQEYWFPVEIASFLLLVALVGALYLGRSEERRPGRNEEGP